MTLSAPSTPRPEQRVEWDEWWRAGANQALLACASTGELFSADTLRDDPFSLPEPRHPAHWGALFSAARAAGLIQQVGYTTSKTPSRHGGVTRTWQGRPDQVLSAPA